MKVYRIFYSENPEPQNDIINEMYVSTFADVVKYIFTRKDNKYYIGNTQCEISPDTLLHNLVDWHFETVRVEADFSNTGFGFMGFGDKDIYYYHVCQIDVQ